MIPILPPTPENICRAAEALCQGKLVAMPTETVYGLAGDALNPQALARIFEVKQRPFFDPLIVHLSDPSWVDKLCSQIPEEAATLMERFWPGPLTLVLPKKEVVPTLATAGLGTVAIRIPSHPVALALLKEAATPLAAPSANPFGRLSPTRSEHVAADFSEGLDCILEGGPCTIGVESTVIGWEEGTPWLLRAGGIALEEIEAVLKMKLVYASETSTPQSPGHLPWHYAPRTPLRLWDEAPLFLSNSGLLWFGGENLPRGFTHVENLSLKGDLQEAAANLFTALHHLDNAGVPCIYARLLPERGLGRAINDRLRKAAATPPSASLR